jgi:hypothetical protein
LAAATHAHKLRRRDEAGAVGDVHVSSAWTVVVVDTDGEK